MYLCIVALARVPCQAHPSLVHPFQGVFLLFYLAPPSVTASYFPTLPPFSSSVFPPNPSTLSLAIRNRFFFIYF
ncbi:hypothetical protein CGRA01v4_14194 [Colletotrichum graminicola]|nr:hypothetical protein CGRA01v4_14194 [Colletotrichum graminicola]